MKGIVVDIVSLVAPRLLPLLAAVFLSTRYLYRIGYIWLRIGNSDGPL
jgi:hypothetical protein